MGHEREDIEADDDMMIVRRKYDNCAIRAKDGKYAPDPDNHRMWFRLSTPELWGDGLLLEPKAFKKSIKRYLENPVVPDSHSYAPMTERLLAKMTDVEFDEQGPIGQLEFAVGTPHGQWADYLYFNGFGNAGSVGFELVKTEQDETEDGRKFIRVKEAKLLEFSLVMLPMDEGALAQHEKREVLVRALHAIEDDMWGADHMDDEAELETRWGAGGGAAGYKGGRAKWRKDLCNKLSTETIKQNVSTHRRTHQIWINLGNSGPMHSGQKAGSPDLAMRVLPPGNWEDSKPTPMTNRDVLDFHWIVIAVLEKQMKANDKKLDHPAAPSWAKDLVPAKVQHDAEPTFLRPGWDTEGEYIKYRIRDPGLFKEGSYKTLSLDVKGTGDVKVTRGRLKKDDDKMHAQRVMFQKEAGWTLATAKSWYAKHEDELKRAVKFIPECITHISWSNTNLDMWEAFSRYAHAYADGMEDDGGMLPLDRDRIQQILEELVAIRTRLEGLIEAGRYVDATSKVVIPVRESDPPNHTPIATWRSECAELIKINEGLQGKALRDKVRNDLKELSEQP